MAVNIVKISRVFIPYLLLALLFCGAGCRQKGGQSPVGNKPIVGQNAPVRQFLPPTLPSALSPEEFQAYMVEHYWDNFDFSDTLFMAEVDPQQMITAYAVYVSGYVSDATASKAISRLMAQASTSRRMFDYFVLMAEQVLHDPNSPLRSDEKYIPVLEAILSSPLYSELERLPYEHDLRMARQNRIGEVANNFRYTLSDGSSAMMHDIDADYLLILISNPGCPMCREIKTQISSSSLLSQLSNQGRFKVLVVYPDEDLSTWREHLGDYPTEWINAYDKGQTITEKGLYDLRAIPAIYLLDDKKRVMAKDCTDVGLIEQLITEAEAK